MANNAPNPFSSTFCFVNLTRRKMSIIFRLQGVCTYLVPIKIQQYGAEQENNGASNLCLVLHNVCLLVHSVFMIRKRKALNLNNTLNSNILYRPVTVCCCQLSMGERSWLSKCLQCVELGSIECMRLYFFEAVSNQVPVKDTMLEVLVCCQTHQGQRTEHPIT